MPKDAALTILGAAANTLLVTLVLSFGRARSARRPHGGDRPDRPG